MFDALLYIWNRSYKNIFMETLRERNLIRLTSGSRKR